MADMLLTRSAAPQVIECAPGARFVFTFPADAATLSRSGDDLVLNVEGGSTITLSDFYGTYTQEEMPSFAVDGTEVAGADFFAALEQPELMPAAGPEPANDSHYQEWSNMDLLGGLDRLGGLDVGWQDPGPRDDEDGGLNSGDINYPVRLFAGEYGSDGPGEPGGNPDDIPDGVRPPGTPDPLDPDTPEEEFYPEDPTDPADDPANMATTTAHLFVREEDLGGNTPPTDSGWLYISAPDGVASIVIGGFTVWEDGALTGTTTIPTDEGYLEVTAFDEQSGKLEFTYTLTRATQEHSADGADVVFSHALPITVTDTDGESATAAITVTIKDDIPTAADDSVDMHYSEAYTPNGDDDADGNVISGTVLNGVNSEASGPDHSGQDGWNSRAVTAVEGGTADADGTITAAGRFGTLVMQSDGTYDYTLSGELPEGEVATESFTYTVTDADGDTATATLDIRVSRPGIGEGTDPDPTSDPDPKPGTDPDGPGTEPATPHVTDNKIVVDEGALAEGSGTHVRHGISGTGSFSVDLNGENGTIAVGGQKITIEGGEAQFDKGVIATVHGVEVKLTGVTAPAEGSEAWEIFYSYELTREQTHDQPANDTALNGTIAITVVDGSGSDKASAELSIEVHDDVPVLTVNDVSETATINFGADDTEARSVQLLAGEEAVAWGENGASDLDTMPEDVTWTSADGRFTVTRGADGEFTFGLAVKTDGLPVAAPGKYVFTVQAVDADGDTVSQSLTLTAPNIVPGGDIPDPTPDPDPNPGTDPDDPGTEPATPHITDRQIVVDEGALAEGSGTHVRHGISGTGSFSVDLNGENGIIAVGGQTITIKDGAAQFTAGEIATVHGVEVMLTGVTAPAEGTDAWEISYSYKLTGAQKHGADGSTTDTTLFDDDSIGITVTDQSGDKVNAAISVEVHDDVPVLTVNDVSETATINFGADDTNTASRSIQLLADGTAVKWASGSDLDTMPEHVTWTSADGRFTVTRDADGEFTFGLAKDDDGLPVAGPGKYAFTVQAVDADGDTVSQPLTLTAPNIVPGGDIPDPDNPSGAPVTPHVTDNKIVVDDADAAGVTLGHVGHGSAGTGSFVVDLHGEDGRIEVGDQIINIVGGKAQFTAGGEIDTVHDVQVKLTGVTAPAEGSDAWEISYSYVLTGAQTHDRPDNDTTLFDDESIGITVTDQSGDVVNAAISVEVHDHIPVVKVTGEDSFATNNNFTITPEQDTNLTFSDNYTPNKTNGEEAVYLNEFSLPDGMPVTMKAVKVALDYKYTAGLQEEKTSTDSGYVTNTVYKFTSVTADIEGDYSKFDYDTDVSSPDSLKIYETNQGRNGLTVHDYTEGAAGRLRQEIDAPQFKHNNATTDGGGAWVLSFKEDAKEDTAPTTTLGTSGKLTDLASEGIEFDLGGKLAYGIKLNLGAFYSADGDGGNADDPDPEHCLVLFLKNKELVGVREYTSDKADGQFATGNIGGDSSLGAFLGGGFDKLIIVSKFQGGNSDFNVDDLEFFTQPNAVASTHGNLDIVAADGANGYPSFDVVANGSFSVDLKDGAEKINATYRLYELNTGNSRLQAVYTDGAGQEQILFTATIEEGSGGWQWSFEVHKFFKLSNGSDFELNFKWNDADGDIGHASVTLNTLNNTLLDTNTIIDGSELDDMLFGTDEGEGISGKDTLDGGLGNDFLNGGTGADMLYGGEGSDIFVFDGGDALIHGGTGIDFLLGDTDKSLSELSDVVKVVKDVEVLIKGDNSVLQSLTSMDALADKGISVVSVDDDKVVVLDNAKWVGSGSEYTSVDGLTLEVDTAAAQIVLQSTTGV